jgi:hypothetical protein
MVMLVLVSKRGSVMFSVKKEFHQREKDENRRGNRRCEWAFDGLELLIRISEEMRKASAEKYTAHLGCPDHPCHEDNHSTDVFE